MEADAVLSGGIIAIGSFSLAVARDAYRRHQDRRAKDRAVLAAIGEEVSANLRTAENNRNLVRTELQLIEQNMRHLNPLDPLEAGFWELVKLDPPRGLVLDTVALAHVREVARLVSQVNEMTRSRETFRVSSPLLTVKERAGEPLRWVELLRGYDLLLDRFLGELLEALHRVEPAISAGDATHDERSRRGHARGA